jgi:hypothetical protein
MLVAGCRIGGQYHRWQFRANCHVARVDGQSSEPLGGQVVSFRTSKADGLGEEVPGSKQEFKDTTDTYGDCGKDFDYDIWYSENWMTSALEPQQVVRVRASIEYQDSTYRAYGGYDPHSGGGDVRIPLNLTIEVPAGR